MSRPQILKDETPKPKCRDCPLLRVAAEQERMAAVGILPDEDGWSFNNRIKAIQVGVMRDRDGCKGPQPGYYACPLANSQATVTYHPDPNVPLLRRKVDDGQDDKYL